MENRLVAQGLEHSSYMRTVVGSNPTEPTISKFTITHEGLYTHMAHTRKVDSEFGKVSRPSANDELGYVGEIGDRLIFFLKYISSKETRRGYRVHTLRDEVGNLFTLFGNDINDNEGKHLAPLYCYIIKATVKHHTFNDYKDQNTKDTVINRPKVLKTIGIQE